MRYVVATDGSGDFTALQAAVDAAAPGDEILVKPGIYRERVVVHRDGLRITGPSAVADRALDIASKPQNAVSHHDILE